MVGNAPPQALKEHGRRGSAQSGSHAAMVSVPPRSARAVLVDWQALIARVRLMAVATIRRHVRCFIVLSPSQRA